jgi:hypothetical protein
VLAAEIVVERGQRTVVEREMFFDYEDKQISGYKINSKFFHFINYTLK